MGYVRMEFISEHKDYNLDIDLYNMQCNSMEQYLNENYSIEWLPMLETAYLDFLDKRNELYEGLITSYPIDSVYDFFCKRNYNIKYIKDHNSTQSLQIVSNKKDYVFNKMEKYGYYCSHIKHLIEYDVYLMIFTPKYSYECTQEVYENNMELYHLTNDRYIDKILTKGLIPRHQNKIEYNHPDRVYLAKIPFKNMGFVKQMYNTMKNKDDVNKLYVLKIDLSKCEDKRFFKDNIAPNGIFTYENIPPKAISIYKEIDVNEM